jgi:hypothetical protein
VYQCHREGIAPVRRETFPVSWIVLENLLHVSTWVVAGTLLWSPRWLGWPLATVAWAILVVVVQVLLKKHNCSGCYYYGKRCHLGWGLLSARMFREDSGSPGAGTRLSLFYVVGPPVILVASILIGTLQRVRTGHWFLLGAFVALNAVVLAVRPRGCRLCAMRRTCPGSAAKDR